MNAEYIGYFALTLGLLAISMKRIIILRFIHATSALVYLVYGSMIGAKPVILAGVLFMIIHAYQIFLLLKPNKSNE